MRDTFDFLRRSYPSAKWLEAGATCMAGGELGVVVRGSNYVHVRIHGRHHTVPYHPSNVEPHEFVEPPKLRRRSEPERVTEHVRRSSRPVKCCRCGIPIQPGERYRQSIGVQAEWSDRSFHLARAHSRCVDHLDPVWAITPPPVQADPEWAP